jgi:hypothetical protein
MTAVEASGDLKVIRWLVTLRARNLGYRCEEVTPDVLAVTKPDGQRQDVPLASLYQAATALPRSEWMAAINEFLDSMLNPTSPDEENLDTIRPLLRTKLVPQEAAQQLSAVCDEFGQDLVEGLVIDRALTMEWVTRERASRWSADEYELLRQGRQNVRTTGRLDVRTVEVGGVRVSVLSGDDYASTHLFWLDEYELVGQHGTLVSAPTRTTVLAAPIAAGTTGFHYLPAMVKLTMSMYEDAKHPLMPRVYHWDPEVMEMMGQVLGAALLQLTGDRLDVIVNPAFQESQEALTP